MQKSQKIPYDPTKPAYVIAFASPKGGPGKTTLAVSVSAELGRRAEGPVALVDLDSTANAYSHLSLKKDDPNGFPVQCENLAPIVNQAHVLAARLTSYKNASQFLVIDTPGAIENNGAQFALTSADMVIVPMRPASYDFAATNTCLEVLQRVAMLRAGVGGQKHVVVLNCPERTTVGQMAENQAASLAEQFKAHLAAIRVRKRVSFEESAVTGYPLWVLGAGAKEATSNIEQLVDELLGVQGTD